MILQRPPSSRHPAGVFKVVPCHGCASSRPPPRKGPSRARKGATQGALPSRLHLRIREALGLASLGFRSEQTVEGLLVDELHWRARLVIEVNGDLVHANPALYGPEDMIVLGDKQYTAQTKWMSDLRKQQHLRSRGYRVLVVWESDDLDSVRVELARLLTSPP